jgi:hypothetical protein
MLKACGRQVLVVHLFLPLGSNNMLKKLSIMNRESKNVLAAATGVVPGLSDDPSDAA